MTDMTGMTDIIERLRIESRREPHEPIWRDAIDEIEMLRAEVERLRRGPHPATTHCDNCGCDWLDNGINPIGCPYCKQSAEAKILVAERDEDLLRQALDALAYWLEYGETPGSHDIIQRTHDVLRKHVSRPTQGAAMDKERT